MKNLKGFSSLAFILPFWLGLAYGGVDAVAVALFNGVLGCFLFHFVSVAYLALTTIEAD